MPQHDLHAPVDARASLLIDGSWRAADATFDVTDPATGEVIGHVADAGPEIAREFVDAAAAAFATWRDTPAERRGEILRDAAAIIRARLDELGELLTRENGKPVAESRGELVNCVRTLEWSAEEGRRAYGRVVPAVGGRRALVWPTPVGVTLAISPWNFPASMLLRKIALALAAGCTVIAKPAEQTPLIAIELARAFVDAGLPSGCLNLVTTSRPGAVVVAIVADDRVRKLTFTGSTEVGLELSRSFGDRLKRISLELGGNAPLIVFEDADVDAVVEDVLTAKFKNAGQSCVAANRLYVHESIAARFAERLVARVAQLVVGNGLDPDTDVGPLIDDAAVVKVHDHVRQAVASGARVLVGGERAAAGDRFYAPTVVGDVTDDMTIAREETFGPVLGMMTFASETEVVARANDSRFGLAAYAFGADVNRMWRVADALEYGVVGINDPAPILPELPFGGMKDSGQEREGGVEGLEAYLDVKAVSFRTA